jgi:thiamine biosynthesis lipoprotein
MSPVNRRKFLVLAAGAGGLAALGSGYRFLSRASGPLRDSPDTPGLPGLSLAKRTSHVLGAKVTMVALHEDKAVVEKALDAAFGELTLVDELLSVYRSDSQVGRLNQDGSFAHPHPYFVEVLKKSTEISELSGGAFDVTVQPLWQLYAREKAAGRLPDASAIQEARRRVDWRKLEVSRDRVLLKGQGMAITLNGIAQGFAGDKVLAALRSHGIRHALVDTGEIGALGRKSDGEAWTVGIQHPRRDDAYVGLARLEGACLATSGDYVTTFTPDRAHHHIFDPATGHSPVEFASVTVLAPTGTEADGLSTAVFVLGVEKGFALLERIPGAEALAVKKDGEVLATSGFPRELRA